MDRLSFSETCILCFGSNTSGQLGISDTIRKQPYNPAIFANYIDKDVDEVYDVRCGSQFTLLIKRDGQLNWCGVFNGNVSPDLTEISELPCTMRFTQVACGRKHILGLIEGQIVVSWGTGFFGQLGHGDECSWDSPRMIQALHPKRLGDRTKSVVCGGAHSGILTETGRMYMWGLNNNGQCGIISKADTVLEPQLVPFAEASTVPIQLCCGRTHSLAVTDAGRVYSWGSSRFGQLGLNESIVRFATPSEIPSLTHVRVACMAVGDFHNLALTTDNLLYSWGYNAEGQCGLGHVFHMRTPHQVLALADVALSSVACGSSWSVAVSVSGNMYSWGYGDGGWLGLEPGPAMPFVDPDCEPDPKRVLARITSFLTRSFESKHNVLAPTRVRALDPVHVTDVRCGGAHCIIFGNRRSRDEEMGEDHSEGGKLGEEGVPTSNPGTDGESTSMDEDDSGRAGADADALDPSLEQVFSWCRHKKMHPLERALVRGAVNVNSTDEQGNSLLIVASQNGHTAVCELLLKFGANINLRNCKGNGALHYCFNFNFNDLGRYLIARGADDFAVNNEGLTCYEGLTLADLDGL